MWSMENMNQRFEKTKKEIEKAFYNKKTNDGDILQSQVITNVLLWEILKELKDEVCN